MIVLGLHFGHDASIAVLRDGVLVAFQERERIAGIKHVTGLRAQDVHATLAVAGASLRDVALVAVTSTQDFGYLLPTFAGITMAFGHHRGHVLPSPHHEAQVVAMRRDVALPGYLVEDALDPESPQSWLVEPAFRDAVRDGALTTFPPVESFGSIAAWERAGTTAGLRSLDLRDVLADRTVTSRLRHPIRIDIDGVSLPAYMVAHHLAHAAYAYVESGHPRAAILSHDGYWGPGYAGGMIYWAEGGAVVPLVPHHLCVGSFYSTVAWRLGLGSLGGEGKLMGLAPWGRPRFAWPEFIGNYYDLAAELRADAGSLYFERCMAELAAGGEDASVVGRADAMTTAVNADIAASAQQIFEATMLATCHAAFELLARHLDGPYDLVLSGGAALNCPANRRIARETPYRSVFAPPGCSDLGLSIGAAALLWMELTGERPPHVPRSHGFRGYSEAEWDAALGAERSRLDVEVRPDATEAAAELLHADEVIAWFDGAAELGPRALGHRSLLAHPGHAHNWARVNRIKGREAWRPLAPAVLLEHAAEWFDGPIPSPHMLFTHRVRNDRLPAVTHVDGSARVQTVAPADGAFRRLIERFHALSGLPVVMNTSLNGRGQPILESPEQAIRFLLTAAEVDALVTPTRIVRRKRA